MDTAEVELATRLKKAEDNLRLAQKKFENAQDNLAKASDPTNALREEERARRYERDCYQEEVSILPRRITRTKDRRLIWQRRYDVVNGNASIEQIQNWVAESNGRISGLDIDKGYCSSILTEIRKDLGAVTEKFEQLKDEKSVTDKLIAQQKFLQDRISLLEDNIARIESLKRFHHTLLDEIRKQTQTLTWEESFQYFMAKLNDILSYSVWSSSQQTDEAQEYNLTVSNIAAALAYLIFGIYIARLVSRYGIVSV